MLKSCEDFVNFCSRIIGYNMRINGGFSDEFTAARSRVPVSYAIKFWSEYTHDIPIQMRNADEKTVMRIDMIRKNPISSEDHIAARQSNDRPYSFTCCDAGTIHKAPLSIIGPTISPQEADELLALLPWYQCKIKLRARWESANAIWFIIKTLIESGSDLNDIINDSVEFSFPFTSPFVDDVVDAIFERISGADNGSYDYHEITNIFDRLHIPMLNFMRHKINAGSLTRDDMTKFIKSFDTVISPLISREYTTLVKAAGNADIRNDDGVWDVASRSILNAIGERRADDKTVVRSACSVQ